MFRISGTIRDHVPGQRRELTNHFIEKCIDPVERSDEFRYYDARILSKNPFGNHIYWLYNYN